MLEEFLVRKAVSPIYSKGWVDVMIDVDRDTGGKAMNDRLKGERSGGLPWSVILDPDGNEIVSSNAEKTGNNIGGPASVEECAWFIEMLKRSAIAKVTAGDLERVAADLEVYSEPRRRPRRRAPVAPKGSGGK